jgi:hypothetical protein
MWGGSSATKDVADRERPAGTPSFQLFDKGLLAVIGSAALAVDGVGGYTRGVRDQVPDSTFGFLTIAA